MKQSLQDAIKREMSDTEYPEFDSGDQIRVTTREEIGGEMRTRHFEGVCIAKRGDGIDKTFKVRKMSFGVGVERIFPLFSPMIDTIEVLQKGKVNQSKLSYLEDRSSKDARIEEEDADLEEINAPNAESAETTTKDQDSGTIEDDETGETDSDEQTEAGENASSSDQDQDENEDSTEE